MILKDRYGRDYDRDLLGSVPAGISTMSASQVVSRITETTDSHDDSGDPRDRDIGGPRVEHGFRRQEGAERRPRGEHHVKPETDCVRQWRIPHETYGCFPPAYIADQDGRPMHSWRVLLLPFPDQPALYDAYNFSEPWNGPNNRKLADQIGRIYLRSGLDSDQAGTTSFVAVVGSETAWPGATTSRAFCCSGLRSS